MPRKTNGNYIKGTDVPQKRLIEQARNNIPVGKIVSRLSKHIEGGCKMSTTQIRAAEILLRKCMPDLQAIQVDTGQHTGLAELLKQAAEAREKAIVGEVIQDQPEQEKIAQKSADTATTLDIEPITIPVDTNDSQD